MSQDFQGKRVLITGANSGIGRATAEAFGRKGARVVVNYLSGREVAEAVAAAISASGGEAFAHCADVAQEAEVQQLYEAAVQRFGGLDIVVANAGVQHDRSLMEMTLQDWHQVIEVNLTGAFLTARAAVRAFERQAPPLEARNGPIGVIVFVSSVHEIIPWAGRANYTASKGGIKLLMQTLAQELAPRRIRVNAVAPGAVRTAINEAQWRNPSGLAAMLRRVPYGRIGEPEDIAKAVLWLASPEADYVVGASLLVDGGMSLYPSFLE